VVEAVAAFAADHDMTAPLDGRARQRIVWGGVDPGSARIGIAAATGEHGSLASAMTPVVVEVGRKVEFPVPLVKTNSAGETYTVTHERIVTDADIKHAAAVTLAHLRLAEVTHVAIERVENPYPGDGNRGKTMAMMKAGARTDRIANKIGDAAELVGIVVVYVTRQAWTARLRRLIQAVTPGELPGKGDAVRGHGVALGAVLVDHVAGWPIGEEDNPDTRDAGGIVLWQALPPATAWKRPPSAPRTKRTRREGDGGSRQARRDKDQRAAARVASGCTCGQRSGRHRKDCPMHVAKVATFVDACACPARCSFLGPECPGRRAARRAKIIA